MVRNAILIAVILTALCVSAASANVGLMDLGGEVGFRIPYAVTIAPGSVYYQTDAGKVFVSGDAVSATDGSVWQWKMQDGRTVTADFVPCTDGYRMKLSAEPSKGITGWGFAVKASPDEYFTGIMERIVDGDQSASWQEGMTQAMDMRGQRVDMFVKPTTAVYDSFYLSNKGYGLAVNSTWPGVYDFCAEDPDLVQIAFEGPTLDCRFFLSDDPAEIVKAHAKDSGPPVLPPKWAFTPWRWRDDHSNRDTYYDGTKVETPYNSMVVEDMLMMDAFDIPCGVYWIDRPWAIGGHGYDDFTWDPNRFPNHKEMVRWLNDQGSELVVWIAPWVMGKMHSEAREKGYNLKGQTGNNDARTLIDFTNPEAVEWWQQGVKSLLDVGVAGFKLDRSEELVPSDRNIFAHDGRTTRELHNDYPHIYLKATYDIARQVRGNDFALMPRAAFTGSTRYGVFWGGDVHGSEWGLRASIVALQKSAVMGYPFWGCDTGGYWGPLDHEVMSRWLAFSAFCPIMEVGPTKNRGLWDMPDEPKYDANLIAIWRMYAKIHDGLKDYSYRYAKEAHESGMPVARPLFLAYADQQEAWNDWQTYLYGEDILVSAIWEKGTTQHTLYLPADETWVDAWTGEKYEGGRKITVDAPLHRMPIFIRKGSKVSLGNLNALWEDSLARAQKKPDLAVLQKKVK